MWQNSQHGCAKIYGTTILCVRRGGETIIAADGQVSLGNQIMKSNANKIRLIDDGKIVVGFAGSTADAFALFERLENKLSICKSLLIRACVELAKDWRTDKYLRRLEAMLIVADSDNTFILSGSGDVIEPEYNVASIGSGSMFALSAARALCDNTDLCAEEIALKSMKIAASICVFSNDKIITRKLSKNMHENSIIE